MANAPGFTYSHTIDSVADQLDPILAGAPTDIVKAVAEILAQLRDRDSDVEDFLTGTLAGQKDVTTITATAGGATITFAKNFSRTPVVTVSMGDSAAGKTVNVVDSSRSNTSFKVQVFNGAVEVVAGNFKVAWIAA